MVFFSGISYVRTITILQIMVQISFLLADYTIWWAILSVTVDWLILNKYQLLYAAFA